MSNPNPGWHMPRWLRYILAGLGGGVIGLLTGLGSGEAAAHVLRLVQADPAFTFGVMGAFGGAATGLVAADD